MRELIGRSLHHYRVLEILGEGGMGVVFKGRDQTLQREVAIKVMHPHYARQQNFRQRFAQEARSAARLDHPGIVQVYDFNQLGDLLYIVMEFIPGDNLGKILHRLRSSGKWVTLPEAVELVRQTALAVQYAHERGVLHRDLKPDNIMLRPEPGRHLPYQPVITDLGLAKLAEGGLATTQGMLMGTPAYMSPEQALGEASDARSDVYSLGVLLYELATGRPPFPARNLSEAIRYHTREQPPSPRWLRPELPIELEEIILKALAKRPEERFAGAGALAAALAGASRSIHSREASSEQVEASIEQVGGEPPLQPVPLESQLQFFDEEGSAAWEGIPEMEPGEAPRIQILSPDGAYRQVEVPPEGLTAGRGRKNDLVLEDPLVSRRHARIQMEGGELHVTDLDSNNGTYIEGKRLLPGIPEPWRAGTSLSMGDTWMRWTPAIPRPAEEGSGVTVWLEEDQLWVRPGDGLNARLRVRNEGESSGSFTVRVEGIPEEWITERPMPFQLQAGEEAELLVRLSPPRHFSSRAGQYEISFLVLSQEAGRMDAPPGTAAEARASLIVAPYTQYSSEIQPEVIQRGTAARVSIQNAGNLPESFHLEFMDPSGELNARPAQARVNALEGGRTSADFNLSSRRPHWFGGERRYPFSIKVEAQDGSLQVLPGEFRSRAHLPVAVLALFVLLCLGLSAGGLALANSILGRQQETPPIAQATEAGLSPTEEARETEAGGGPAATQAPEDTPAGAPAGLPAEASPTAGGEPANPSTDFSGTWLTNFATLELEQEGRRVTGRYSWYGADFTIPIEGTVEGRRLNGFFGGVERQTITFTLSEDGQSFEGSWSSSGSIQYQWCGTRGGPLPPGCGFSGIWLTLSDFAPDGEQTAELVQVGNRVTGTFDHGSNGSGSLEGEIGTSGENSHYTLRGTYEGVNAQGPFSGSFTWTLVGFDARQFRGVWSPEGGGSYPWCGWREGEQPPDPCRG